MAGLSNPAGTLQSLERLESRAVRFATACGNGAMLWHRWGAGDPVILLHGAYGSWTHWIRNVEALAERHMVLAPDLPGLGASAMPPEPADGTAIARILATGLDDVIPQATAFHLVGFSFGGVVAGPLAVALGRRLRSFTLVGSGGLGAHRNEISIRRWRDAESEEDRRAIHWENLARLMLWNSDHIDELAVEVHARNAENARLRSRDISRSGTLRDALPQLTLPVNAIYGERDATAFPHLADRRAKLHELSRVLDFRVIPDAGHWVQYEAADAFNTVLLKLLARIS